jgi:hypothetical protein
LTESANLAPLQTGKKGVKVWLDDNLCEIEQVYEFLGTRLSDNPVELNNQLAEVEAWHARMTSLLADANSFLDLAERAALEPRSKEYTDLDRSVRHAAAVVNERRLRDKLEGLCSAIETRLTLGMSMMKRMSGEKQRFNG